MSPLQKYTVTDKSVMSWAEKYPTVLNYLSKINSYRERAATDLYLYCEWSGKNPDELLALKNSFESLDAEKLLDKFVYTKLPFPDTRKWQLTMKVRGFYRANYRSLASSAGKMEYPPAKAQRAPSKQQRKVFLESCYNPRDEALVMAVSCSALALETLSMLRWYHFEEDWLQQEIPHISVPSDLLKGHGKGKYRGVRQETFLTPEAKAVFIKYRDWFSKTFKHQWTKDDFVFLSTKRNIGEPLTRLILAHRMARLSERSGVPWSIHDGRRIVQTALESVGTSSNWIKKIKGRKCSGEESPYSKPNVEQLREKYREALPELEFLSESNVNLKRLEEMEQKITEKDQVIEVLAKNGAELKAKVEQIEGSKEYLKALLERVMELEKKLSVKS
jgi:uncharacterized coiled-coil protein SlyX